MILFTEKEIQDKVKEIAERINKIQHEQPPVYICVLNGAFMFFTDLVKQLGECEIDFIRAKSYTGTQQGSVSITKTVETNIVGLDLSALPITVAELAARTKEAGLWISALGPKYARLVTHMDFDDAMCKEAVEILKIALVAK